ncbi:MAG: hypothetical protein SPL43_08055 [Prevotella sp.]|nr:hypothetical protein [Prevotella sp.]
MKAKGIIIAACAFMALGTPVHAQGLGSLLKKAKEMIAPSDKNQTGQNTAKAVQKGAVTAIEGGGTLQNPLKPIVDVQLVGAYGKSTSTNYGVVKLVFKVKMIANLTSVRFGGNTSYPAIMVDQDGNSYKMRSAVGWYSYDVTEGVYMKLELKENSEFVDVKKTATTIQQLQIGISTSYENTGLLVLRDVPIKWDENADK